jgi:hypothetical protein
MAKTNFTKVEEVLEQGLRKYSVDHLLEAADKASGAKEKPPHNPSISYTADANQPQPPALTKDQTGLIHSLQRDLKRFQKRDPALYKLLGISKKNLKMMLDQPAIMTEADWETIKQIRTKLDQHKADLSKQLPKQSNEDLVEAERKDHLNRRYNVNKKWLPLT